MVTGIVRNCGSHLAPEVSRLAGALRGFRQASWLLIESDSSDDTLSSLGTLADRIDDFRFVSLGRLRDSIPLRIERLARCRNAYLDEIRRSTRYADVDFVLVADFDGTNKLITEHAIASCWQRDDWDVCTANQRGPYYDVWALRHPYWSPNDCWAQYNFLLQHHVSSEAARSVAVHSRMIRLEPDADWIEVESAFGGLAIYRRPSLDDGAYLGVDAEGRQICEHVSLHAAMRAQGRRIFINPRLINTEYTEHTAALFVKNKMVRLARRTLRQVLQRAVGRHETAITRTARRAKV